MELPIITVFRYRAMSTKAKAPKGVLLTNILTKSEYITASKSLDKDDGNKVLGLSNDGTHQYIYLKHNCIKRKIIGGYYD